jgi:hypothetical protein
MVKKYLAAGIRSLVAFALLLGSGLFVTAPQTSAQTGTDYIFDVREIETAELELPTPAGLAFSPAATLLSRHG